MKKVLNTTLVAWVGEVRSVEVQRGEDKHNETRLVRNALVKTKSGKEITAGVWHRPEMVSLLESPAGTNIQGEVLENGTVSFRVNVASVVQASDIDTADFDDVAE